MSATNRRRRHGQEGQATVELALCLPIAAILLGALVEVGSIVGDQARLEHAAREAARVAIVDPDEGSALSAARGSGLRDLSIEIEPPPELRVQGDPLTVELRHHPDGTLPLLGSLFRRIELEARAVMRIERP